jgi:pimeloyl-ACP methyl ester carboxylesterase
MPTAKVNGININYQVEGQGEPLLMVTGYSADLSGWKFQTSVFKKDFRVIIFDNRGAGKSDKPKGPYSIAEMARDAIGLLDYLKIERANILGVSMGGMIAQEIAINYPERTLKLVLGSTHAGHDKGASGSTAAIIADWELPVRQTTERLLGLCCNKLLNRLIIVPFMQIKTRRLGESEAAGLEGQKIACAQHYALDRLSKIKAATLVIAGSADRVIMPSSSDAIAQKIVGAGLVKVKNGSHTLNWEMRKRFNSEVLNFLKGEKS